MGSQTSAILGTASANFGNVSAAVQELWIRRALSRLTPDLVMVPICADGGPGAWKEIPVHEGTKVHFHRLPVLAAATTAITQNADDPAATTAAFTGVTAEVATYGDWMKIGDMAEDTSLYGAMDAMAEALAQGMQRTADTLVYNQIKTAGTSAATEDGGTLAASASITAEANHGCTRQNLEYMCYTLKNANVRQFTQGTAKGRYYYACHPFAVKTLRSITAVGGYVDVLKNMGMSEELRGAHVGNIAGFAIHESTEVTTALCSAATTAVAYQNVAAGYESVGMVSLAGNAMRVPQGGVGPLINQPEHKYRTNVSLIVKGLDTGGAENPMNRRGSVAYKLRTVAKVLDANRVYTHLCYGGAG